MWVVWIQKGFAGIFVDLKVFNLYMYSKMIHAQVHLENKWFTYYKQVEQYNGTAMTVAKNMIYNTSNPEGTIVASVGGKFKITFTSDAALQSEFFEIQFGTGNFFF